MPTNKKLMKKHELTYSINGIKVRTILAVWENEVQDVVNHIVRFCGAENVHVNYNLTLKSGRSAMAAIKIAAQIWQDTTQTAEERQKLDSMWFKR